MPRDSGFADRRWLVVPSGSLATRLVWSLGANVLASLNVLLSALFAARWLGPASFGRLSLLLSAQSVLATLIASSVGQVATKFTAELHDADPARLASIRTLLHVVTRVIAVLVAAACLLAPWPLTEALFGRLATGDMTRLAAPALVFAALMALQQGFIAGLGAFRELVIVNVIRFLFTMAALAWLTPTHGLKGAIGALGIAGAMTWLASVLLLRQRPLMCHGHVRLSAAWREVGVLTGFALPSWLSGALFSAAAWFGNYLLSRQVAGLVEVGLFNAANQLGRSLLLFVPNALAPPFLVEISALMRSRNRPAAESLFRRSTLLMMGSAVAAGSVIALTGRWVLGLYGPSFTQGYSVLLVILFTTLLSAFTVSANTTLTALGEVWTVTLATALWFAIFTGALAGWRQYGAMGLAGAYLVAYVAQVGLTVPLTMRALRPRTLT
jgi:O-antigen/teichoic acid export membrane protein